MKRNTLLALWAGTLLGMALPVSAQQQLHNEDNLIRQTDLDTGIRRDYVTSRNSGSMTSLLPISGTGSIFQLWAAGSAQGNSVAGADNVFFLDQKLIGPYQPQAEINIVSEDPFFPPRTRADRPFSYSIRIWGLLTDPALPKAAKEVSFICEGVNYEPLIYSPGNNEAYLIEAYDSVSTKEKFGPVYSRLQGFADPTQTMGEEIFTISTYPFPLGTIVGGGGTDDGTGKGNQGHGNNVDGVDVSNPGQGQGGPNAEEDLSVLDNDPTNDDDEKKSNGSSGNQGNSGNSGNNDDGGSSTDTPPGEEIYSILASAKIQVWPVAQASFEGIDEGQTILRQMPPFTAHYMNSYPRSTTYLQVRKGRPDTLAAGLVVPGTVRVHDTIVPQNDTVHVAPGRFEEVITIISNASGGQDGVYTVEALTITPFNNGEPERLGHFTFNIQRKMEIRGNISSLNNQ